MHPTLLNIMQHEHSLKPSWIDQIDSALEDLIEKYNLELDYSQIQFSTDVFIPVKNQQLGILIMLGEEQQIKTLWYAHGLKLKALRVLDCKISVALVKRYNLFCTAEGLIISKIEVPKFIQELETLNGTFTIDKLNQVAFYANTNECKNLTDFCLFGLKHYSLLKNSCSQFDFQLRNFAYDENDELVLLDVIV